MLWRFIVLVTIIATVGAQMEGHIYGGDFAIIEKYPHSVALLIIRFNRNGSPRIPFICGASVINQMLLLTVAHCIISDYKYNITAFYGDEDRTKGLQRTVGSFVTHENFNESTYANDIGIIKLTEQIQFSAKVKRVALMRNPPYEELAEIAGWGITSPDLNNASYKLKLTDQWVWPLAECQRLSSDYDPMKFCASSYYTYQYPYW